MKVLVTGCAGFIGMHTCERLLRRGDQVLGFDSLPDDGVVRLKKGRLARLTQHAGFDFRHLDVADRGPLERAFEAERPDRVIHLATQGGAHLHLSLPHACASTNLTGFVNILEGCRLVHVQHLVFRGSSTVYGAVDGPPQRENHPAGHPLSLHAATMRAGELMAHAYSHIYKLPATGLRMFGTYGPWCPPDTELMQFADAIISHEPVELAHRSRSPRDLAYIDDVVEAVVGVLDKPPGPVAGFDPLGPDPSTSHAPFRIFNVGSGVREELGTFVAALEDALGQRANRVNAPGPPVDGQQWSADVSALRDWIGWTPTTPVRTGVGRFADWYRQYCRVPAGSPRPQAPKGVLA
jgi:UDP-glucuronate 4-epimerase